MREVPDLRFPAPVVSGELVTEHDRRAAAGLLVIEPNTAFAFEEAGLVLAHNAGVPSLMPGGGARRCAAPPSSPPGCQLAASPRSPAWRRGLCAARLPAVRDRASAHGWWPRCGERHRRSRACAQHARYRSLESM